MILIFDGETSSKSMLLLMRRHLVFRRTLMILIFDGETSSKSMLLLM